jgi:hypothetical protein
VSKIIKVFGGHMKKHTLVLTFVVLVVGTNLFPQADSGKRILNFSRSGHGMELQEEDRSDFDVFLNNHGIPLKIEVIDITTEEEREDSMQFTKFLLYYKNCIVDFRRYYGTYMPLEELYWYVDNIISIEGARYMYKIYIGMPRENFFKALMMEDNGQDYFSIDSISNVEIYFENQVLTKIVWTDLWGDE